MALHHSLHDCQTYAAALASSTLSNTTLGPTPTNPAGIYYTNTTTKLNGGVTINGTDRSIATLSGTGRCFCSGESTNSSSCAAPVWR